MKLTEKQQEALDDIKSVQEFRRERRISYKVVDKNKIHFEGKGYYYYIHHAGPKETVMDVLLDNLEYKNGGYARILINVKKGSKLDLNLLNNYTMYNKRAGKAGLSIDEFGGCTLGMRTDRDLYEQGGITLNESGILESDLVVVQIGGTTNGFLKFKDPSSVNGDLIIRTISDAKLNELKRKEDEEDNN